MGGVERNTGKLATARNSKHEVADRVQDSHMPNAPRDGDSRIVAMDFEHCKEVPVAMTDSKGWSYEQPKSEESSKFFLWKPGIHNLLFSLLELMLPPPSLLNVSSSSPVASVLGEFVVEGLMYSRLVS